MFKKWFAKYARAVSDEREREWLYKKYRAKTVVSIIFYTLCVAIIAGALALNPYIEQDWALAVMGVIILAWIGFAIAALCLWISFKKTYATILNRPAYSDEMPEVVAYRKKVADDKKSTFKKLWWAWAIFGTCVVGFIVCIVMETIYNGDSEEFGAWGTAAIWVLLAGVLVIAFAYIINNSLKQQGMFTYDNNDYWDPYPITEAEKDTVIYLRVNKVLGAVATLFTSILILPEHIWKPLVSVDEKLNNSDPTGEILYQYENPIGCGAWELDTEKSGRQMIVLHNRKGDYHLKAEDGSDLYKVDTVKLMLYMDENTAIYALLKGYVDMLDYSMNSNYMRLFEDEENIIVQNIAGTSTQTLVMNVNPQTQYVTPAREILKNIEVRKAIALAINQEEIIDKVLNGAGVSASAGLMLESQTELYNPAANILAGDYENRLAQANEILDRLYPKKDKEGYRLSEGERISFEILANPGELELVSFLQIQFQKIGIDVQYKAEGSMAEDTYLFDGDFDMTFQATIFNVSNVDIMYQSHFVTTYRSSNYGRLANEELSDKISEMRLTLNQNRKYDLIKEIQEIIAELYYKVPVYASNVISVARTDRFIGYVAGPGETVFNLDTLENLEKVV